jgi:hypothetical protein
MSRGQGRVAESLGEMQALAGEVESWYARWDELDTLGAHRTQLDTLTTLVLDLIAKISAATRDINTAAEPTAIYAACRREDKRLQHVRRLWRWYADKLDQRAADREEQAGNAATIQTLRAADELVWSCWKTAFTQLEAALPPAPIPYLAAEFSAFTTPRTDLPPDLRRDRDALLFKHTRGLPLPLIGLPPICQRRPWWLVIAAHEVGHHVQFDIDGLEEQTQEAVVAAASDAGGGGGEMWRPWCRELFADACAVLLAGPAAIWAITELETGATGTAPGYPPPAIRLAVAHAVAGKANFSPSTERDHPPVPASPDLARLEDCVPSVADALLSLRAELGDGRRGRELRSLAETTARAYNGTIIMGWQEELLGSEEPLEDRTLEGARLCTAGSVAAWQRIADGGQDRVEHLASRVLGVLPRCREDGRRAGAGVIDAHALADELAADLYAEDPDDWDFGEL